MIKKDSLKSYLYSVGLHLVLALVFLFLSFTPDVKKDEYVTIGFGTIGKLSSPGPLGNAEKKETKIAKPEKQKKKKKTEVKKVNVPKTKNTDIKNKVVVAAKEKKKTENESKKTNTLVKDETKKPKGKEISGEGEGNFGFEIDFGGKGKRKIYSYKLPEYPPGVSKEIDVKLKFTILPDGTVGRIIPLIKADTRLEMAAINSLRKWRFEPLPETQNQAVQTAVIVFPFRLR